MIKSATPEQLQQWMQANDAVLIDVREPDEYAQARIAGSILLPLAAISAEQIPPVGDKKLVMQCKTGGRSRAACGKLSREMPETDIYNLEGGIMAWMDAGYSVEK